MALERNARRAGAEAACAAGLLASPRAARPSGSVVDIDRCTPYR